MDAGVFGTTLFRIEAGGGDCIFCCDGIVSGGVPNELPGCCRAGCIPPGCIGVELLLGSGLEVRPNGPDPDWPGTRTTRPQRVQGLLLASHSLPQRGQIMIYLSQRSSACPYRTRTDTGNSSMMWYNPRICCMTHHSGCQKCCPSLLSLPSTYPIGF
jgi:hypothetical protein